MNHKNTVPISIKLLLCTSNMDSLFHIGFLMQYIFQIGFMRAFLILNAQYLSSEIIYFGSGTHEKVSSNL